MQDDVMKTLTKAERDSRWASGDGYNRYISSELKSFRKQAWKDQITRHFPPNRVLDVLDVGTGPGFFACILAEEGHHVRAIDSSEGMLACARENARRLGVSPEFSLMDIDNLTFGDASFDVLVMRNVTWTLQHPASAYADFVRLLKPDGMLLIYDANWQAHFYDEELMQRVRAREQRHFELYGKHEVVSCGDLEYYATAPLTRQARPAWDVRMLERLGCSVEVTYDVGRFVYEEWEKQLYGESPLFEVCAVKGDEPNEQSNMRVYWNERSNTFGFANTVEELDDIARRIGRYLPQGSLRVLDVGTGPGAIACAMARAGHRVSAVDLAVNMLAKARVNADRLGLEIDFVCAPANCLPFEDNAFDVVVSRNLTWALPNPCETFSQWRRILKPGGMLVYLDGNHYRYFFDERTRSDRELVTRMIGSPHGGEAGLDIDYSLCDETARNLPLSPLDRPREWDEQVLPDLGFSIVGEELYMPQKLIAQGVYDKGFYTSFLVAARSTKKA